LLHTLHVLYMCTLCNSTNINTIIEFAPNWQVVKTPTIIWNNPVFCIAGLSAAVPAHHWSAERRAVGRQHADTLPPLLTPETGSECHLHNLDLVDQISLLTCFKHTAVRFECSVCFITRFSCRIFHYHIWRLAAAYPGILLGGSTNSVEDRGQRERGSGGGNPLVRGSGGSCNLVQEISFHIVKFS